MKLISYHRVSTAKQGQSGLGLEAQAAAIRAYAESVEEGQVLATFTEVESGRSNERPEAGQSTFTSRGDRATVVIAKLRPALPQRRLSADPAGQRRALHRDRHARR